ncbi:MAG: hypothetical protein ABJA80_02300 [bacterium]
MLKAIALILGAAPAMRGQVAATPSAPGTATVDSVPSFQRPNGALMRPGAVTYALTLARPAGDTVSLGTRTVDVAEASLGGTPSWLIVDARQGTVLPTTDSIYLTRADLAPERWTATIGRAQLGASFTRDSVFGAALGYQGRSSFSLAIPANVLVTLGMLERVLELLPLQEGYHVAASLLFVQGPTPRIVPADLMVEAADSLVMPGAVNIDAWRVAMHWGASEARFWVARSGARVVRTEQQVPEGVLTAVLSTP